MEWQPAPKAWIWIDKPDVMVVPSPLQPLPERWLDGFHLWSKALPCLGSVQSEYTFGVAAHNLVIPAGGEPAALNCPFSVKPRGHLGWVTLGMKAPRDMSSPPQGGVHQEG